MMTLAQKVVAMLVIGVLNASVLLFGGVVAAFVTVLASTPFTVAVATR